MSALAPRMSIQHALALPAPAPSNTVVINARCSLRIEADQRVIVVAGLPVHHYRAEDAVAEAYAMVSLVEAGFAQQTDVARAFERSARTIRRYQEHYGDDGMAALGREEGWRRGRRRISGKRLRSIEMLKSQGMSNRAIAQRLGVTENAIRKLIGPSKPAIDDAQLALAGIPTAAGKPAESGVPSATPSSENADRTALPTDGHAGDRHPIAAPEAADDDHPVPMSGEVREPGRSLELVEEVPQQWERAGNFFHEARHRGTTIRHGGKLINSLHQGSIFSLKCDHQPAHDGVERLRPSRPKFRIDRQRLIVRATCALPWACETAIHARAISPRLPAQDA
jgi:transposase